MRDISIKMILLGISFLIFSLIGSLISINGGGESITEGIICVLGVLLLPAGLIICIAAIFVKK